DTGIIIREFTTPRDMTMTLDADREHVLIDATAYSPWDTVTLEKGTHRIETRAQWVSLKDSPRQVTYEGTDGQISAAEEERILNTRRSSNAGLSAYIGEVELPAEPIDAAT